MAKPPEEPPEFEGCLRRAWEIGRRRWPEVDLPADVFIRHVAQLLPKASEGGAPETSIEKLDLDGLYLACACASGVPRAIEMFEQHYLAKLPSTLGHLKLSVATLDEICQQVRMHLLVHSPGARPRLAEYSGRGALLSWMRVIASRMALKQGAAVRETPDESIVAALEALPASGTDVEMELIKRRYRHEFRQALGEAFAVLSRDERYLLRLNIIDGLPTTKMAPLFGKDQSTISRWLKDAREKVYEETKHRLQNRLGLSSQEFVSLMDAIKSRFDMSLSQFLNEDNDEESERS
jgi:RNA polymerase sigma-70 factor